MDTFTKTQRIMNKPKDDSELAYKGSYIEIINKDGWEIVKEPCHYVVMLPYLVDDSMILLRREPIPSWNFAYQNTEFANQTHFITTISGGINKDESIVSAFKRELFEEAGIVLSEFFQFRVDGPFFISKGTCNKFYTAILELRYNDFKQVMRNPVGDGSQNEKDSQTIKISLGNLEDITINDCVTELMLTKLKLEYKLK